MCTAGLGSETTVITQILPRLKEAAKLGFERALVPQTSLKGLTLPGNIEVTGVRKLHGALDLVL